MNLRHPLNINDTGSVAGAFTGDPQRDRCDDYWHCGLHGRLMRQGHGGDAGRAGGAHFATIHGKRPMPRKVKKYMSRIPIVSPKQDRTSVSRMLKVVDSVSSIISMFPTFYLH